LKKSFGNITFAAIKYYLLRLQLVSQSRVFESGLTMGITECSRNISERNAREQVETAIVRLQFLKGRVSELTQRCEDLRRLRTEKTRDLAMACDECGKKIGMNQPILVKDSNGRVISHYHQECFRALLR
jgi:hypothetical protein